MKLSMLAIPFLALSACGQAYNDEELLRLGEDMSESSWDCGAAVRSGSDLITTEPCHEFAYKNAEFYSALAVREKEYKESFEFNAREAVGWPKELGYFPCSGSCWEARANAASASNVYRHAIISDLGCDPSTHSSAYFIPEMWDDLRRWQNERPCKVKSESAK